MKQVIIDILSFLWAIASNTVIFFLAVVPLIILSVIIVPIALLFPDDSQKEATYRTVQGQVWWLRRLPKWAFLYDNPVDGSLGDSVQLRWALRDIPFGWKNTDYLAQVWWIMIRNPLHYFKQNLIGCNISGNGKFKLIWGQAFVRDSLMGRGFQFARYTGIDNMYYWRVYWVAKWPWWDRAFIVEIGHEFRQDHFPFVYDPAEPDDKYKGFTWLIHPSKAID